VIPHRQNLGCEGDGEIVGRFPHAENVKRTLTRVDGTGIRSASV
jgi:hypothetical protein